MNLQERYDVAIVGGGFAGSSLALRLAQVGLKTALIEKGTLSAQLEPEFDGRVSAIALGSKRILDALGVWQDIAEHAQPISDIRVSDDNTPFYLHYDAEEIDAQTDGQPFGYIVENRHTRHALFKAVQQHANIDCAENTLVKDITLSVANTALTMQTGETTHASLIIGADGKFSAVRDMVGIKHIKAQYNQTAIVCTIAHEKPHEGLAQERFLPAGPFAVLPMTGNRSSLVWVEPNDRAPIYLELDDENFAQEITERIGGYLGKITVEGKRFSYPLSLGHAQSYTSERLALVGDAAHAIHPIAGQGVNLGFRDVATLSELIEKQHALGLDIGAPSMLAHYQRWRRFDNTTMLAVTDGLNRLFSNDIALIKLARGLGLWAVGKTPKLKQFFMLHAMGLTGDIPAMAKHSTNMKGKVNV